MFGFRAKKDAPEEASGLQRLEHFLDEYDGSAQKGLYAMYLWGIVTAFEKVFGDLEGYHASDPAKRQKYITMLGTNALNDLKEKNIISAACNNFFMNYVGAAGSLDRALTPSLKRISGRVDRIVQHGASKMNQGF